MATTAIGFSLLIASTNGTLPLSSRSRCTGWSGGNPTQREYLQDMLNQVKTGKQAGKTVDEVIRSVNLGRHGGLGSSASGNAASIRAMYR